AACRASVRGCRVVVPVSRRSLSSPRAQERSPILFDFRERGYDRAVVGLQYGDPQIAIGAVFAVLSVLFAAAFAVIARQAGTEVGFDRVHAVGYWLRNRWLAVLVVLGVFVLGISFL